MSKGNRADRIAALLADLFETISDQPDPAPPTLRQLPERTLLTVEEAAERLRIGRTRMYALVKSGEVESILIGRLRRVPVDALNAYTNRLLNEQEAA